MGNKSPGVGGSVVVDPRQFTPAQNIDLQNSQSALLPSRQPDLLERGDPSVRRPSQSVGTGNPLAAGLMPNSQRSGVSTSSPSSSEGTTKAKPNQATVGTTAATREVLASIPKEIWGKIELGSSAFFNLKNGESISVVHEGVEVKITKEQILGRGIGGYVYGIRVDIGGESARCVAKVKHLVGNEKEDIEGHVLGKMNDSSGHSLEFYGEYKDAGKATVLLMERADGDLSQLLSRTQDAERASQIRRVFESVEHLHNEHHVAHGDIKPDAFLRKTEGERQKLFLADFGEATSHEESSFEKDTSETEVLADIRRAALTGLGIYGKENPTKFMATVCESRARGDAIYAMEPEELAKYGQALREKYPDDGVMLLFADMMKGDITTMSDARSLFEDIAPKKSDPPDVPEGFRFLTPIGIEKQSQPVQCVLRVVRLDEILTPGKIKSLEATYDQMAPIDGDWHSAIEGKKADWGPEHYFRTLENDVEIKAAFLEIKKDIESGKQVAFVGGDKDGRLIQQLIRHFLPEHADKIPIAYGASSSALDHDPSCSAHEKQEALVRKYFAQNNFNVK